MWTLKRTRKDTNLKLYKITEVPLLLYGTKNGRWRRETNKIQAAEMKYQRPLKSYTRSDHLRNEDLRKKLNIFFFIWKNIQQKIQLQQMEHIRILLEAYNYCPSDRRDIESPRTRWKDMIHLIFERKLVMSTSRCLCHRKQIHFTVNIPLQAILLWQELIPQTIRETGGSPIVGCPQLPIQYTYSYPQHLEAVSSILDLRTRQR